MTLADLIRRFRHDAFDAEQPYLFSDEAVTGWLNDAVNEAARRARLIHTSGDISGVVIDIAAGVAVYPMPPAIYELQSIRFNDDPLSTKTPDRLHQTSQEYLARLWDDWQYRTGAPKYAVQYDTSIRLCPMPTRAGKLYLEGYRTALAPMVFDTDTPEINQAHHDRLIDWAIHKAFSRPDTETFDPSKADKAEQYFTDYFGFAPTVDLRRSTRTDVPQVVTPCDF